MTADSRHFILQLHSQNMDNKLIIIHLQEFKLLNIITFTVVPPELQYSATILPIH